MSCSCPDYAGVCKHIAATFYGVAARLDHQPELLFKLRKVDHLELIGQATSAVNLDQALSGTAEVALSDSDLGSIFGIELESTPSKSRSAGRPKSQRAVRSKADVKQAPAKGSAAKFSRKHSTKKTPAKKTRAKKAPTVPLAAKPTQSLAAKALSKPISAKARTKPAVKSSKPQKARERAQQPIPAAAMSSGPRSRKKKAA